MSGGYQGKPPTELAPLLKRISDLEGQVTRLQNRRSATAVVTATGVIIADANGVRWRLGVTTSGATTWTQV